MSVRRIVAGPSGDPAVAAFYRALLGLDPQNDGVVVAAPPGLSAAQDGGDLLTVSIEVDDLDAVLARAHAMGATIAYGPATEPSGARRFSIRDPAGTLVHILTHAEA